MPRKTNKISSNKTILILTEGQTEQIYFLELKTYERIQGITVTPKKSPHSDIKHLINSAISEYCSGVYDAVWCVYDLDTVKRNNLEEKLSQLINRAIKKGIRIADSMPAFEIWFLSHFQKPQMYYLDQNAVIEELKKYIEDYNKDCCWLKRKNIYSFLKEKQEQAIANCDKLEQNRNEYGEKCSSCRVYELIQFLLSSSNSKEHGCK